MPRASVGVALHDRVEAVVRNPALYAPAEAFPDQKAGGGRPRDYPAVMLLVFEALISIYGSGRQVEAELGHPVVWDHVRKVVKQESGCELPTRPMRRYHYLYGRSRYLADPAVVGEVQPLHRRAGGRTGAPSRAPGSRRSGGRGPTRTNPGSSTATAR